jgi:hypothetical protein
VIVSDPPAAASAAICRLLAAESVQTEASVTVCVSKYAPIPNSEVVVVVPDSVTVFARRKS